MYKKDEFYVMQLIQLIRDFLRTHKCDGVLIPHHDRFLCEYLLERDQNIKKISNFTGSSGLLVIMKDKAALFVDGRYTLQAKIQVDQLIIEVQELANFDKWIKNLSKQKKITLICDPWLFTEKSIQPYKKVADLLEIPNFLDQIIKKEPHPKSTLFIHEIIYAGQSSEEKLKLVDDFMEKNNVDLLFLQAESWHWLFNVRGSDIAFVPIIQGFAFIEKQKYHLFLYQTNQPDDVLFHLPNDTTIYSMDDLDDFCEKKAHQNLCYDNSMTPIAISQKFNSKIHCIDPCLLLKSCKNEDEIKGMKAAHIKDGLAWTYFWMDVEKSIKESNTLDEWCISEKMNHYRSMCDNFISLSFDTITGIGKNGAIIHYRSEKSKSLSVFFPTLILIDSGSQYKDGTTDITRTLALGKASQEMMDHYTAVLKGQIALSKIKFPKSTTGAQLDVLARQFLWEMGSDYNHGTGHGVGSFLNVHEGPTCINKTCSQELLIGMVLSNEPGIYLENEYGIRLENMMVVCADHNNFLRFKTLTLVPYDNSLINHEMLTVTEKQWICDYYKNIYDKLAPYLKEEEEIWLKSKLSDFL